MLVMINNNLKYRKENIKCFKVHLKINQHNITNEI